MKFTAAKIKEAIIALLAKQGLPHVLGTTVTRAPEEVLTKDGLRHLLGMQ